MKERLPSKRPWNTMASTFFYMFLDIHRLENDMISMRSRFARTQKVIKMVVLTSQILKTKALKNIRSFQLWKNSRPAFKF